jgi:hypothetical protein
MSQVTAKKGSRTPHAVQYDSLAIVQINPVTLAASQANTAVQSTIVFSSTVKIYRVTAYLGAPAVAGTASINLVAGAAAEAGVGIPDTLDNGVNAYPRQVAGAGIQLFATDQVVTMTANTTTQIDVPAPNFDVIWKGAVTLRTATAAGTTGTLYVAVLYRITDIQPWTPEGSGTDVNFTPAKDIA